MRSTSRGLVDQKGLTLIPLNIHLKGPGSAHHRAGQRAVARQARRRKGKAIQEGRESRDGALLSSEEQNEIEGFTFFINRERQTGDCSDEILAGNTVRASTRLQLRPAFRVARQLDPLSNVESLYMRPISITSALFLAPASFQRSYRETKNFNFNSLKTH